MFAAPQTYLLVIGEFVHAGSHLFVHPSVSNFGHGLSVSDSTIFCFFIGGTGHQDLVFHACQPRLGSRRGRRGGSGNRSGGRRCGGAGGRWRNGGLWWRGRCHCRWRNSRWHWLFLLWWLLRWRHSNGLWRHLLLLLSWREGPVWDTTSIRHGDTLALLASNEEEYSNRQE